MNRSYERQTQVLDLPASRMTVVVPRPAMSEARSAHTRRAAGCSDPGRSHPFAHSEIEALPQTRTRQTSGESLRGTQASDLLCTRQARNMRLGSNGPRGHSAAFWMARSGSTLHRKRLPSATRTAGVGGREAGIDLPTEARIEADLDHTTKPPR